MSTATDKSASGSGLLATLLSDDTFLPRAPRTLREAGLSPAFVEGLLLKQLAALGTATGRQLATRTCLPFGVLQEAMATLRTRQDIVYTGSAALGDYQYRLTEGGSARAQSFTRASAYIGPAPVPLADYVNAVEAQSIRAETPRRAQLEKAFGSITVPSALLEDLGPAINSGAGLFLYGSPGNGKSTLARCITRCFSQNVWVPYAIVDDGQIIKLYDPAYHETANDVGDNKVSGDDLDARWVRIRRPTVIVGGELTLDGLEIRHDPRSNTCEAPLQMKSNCGCLLIDDFGRQRIEPTELLNRWIIPLENRVDFLTLPTGKKIKVPFEQLIIFSTNLDPTQLVDEAFMRRIPYKIKVDDPTAEEFHRLFSLYARKFQCEYKRDVVEELITKHYRTAGRPMRRCHPRDLLNQVRDYCAYHQLPMDMRVENFDRAVRSCFTGMLLAK